MFTQEEPGLLGIEAGKIPYTVSPKIILGTAAGSGAFALGAIIASTIIVTTQATKDDLISYHQDNGTPIQGDNLVQS